MNNILRKRPLTTSSDVHPPPAKKTRRDSDPCHGIVPKCPAKRGTAAHKGRVPNGCLNSAANTTPEQFALTFSWDPCHAWAGGYTRDGKLQGRKRLPKGMITLSLDCTDLKCSHWGLRVVSNKCNLLSLSLSCIPNKVVFIIWETPGEVLASQVTLLSGTKLGKRADNTGRGN